MRISRILLLLIAGIIMKKTQAIDWPAKERKMWENKAKLMKRL